LQTDTEMMYNLVHDGKIVLAVEKKIGALG